MKTSLDHLPEYKQQEVQTISTILRDTLDAYLERKEGRKAEYRILKIILFGSHAKGGWIRDIPNGYISDYDILVIVNSNELLEEHIVWRDAEEQVERKVKSAPLGLIVHTQSEVNSWLKQGHYFFKDIREEGIELFSANKKALPLPGNLTEAEQQSLAEKHFNQWFHSANRFIRYFDVAIEDDDLINAAFMLHQVTEKLFSCILLTCMNYLPKTHNIEKLKHLCVSINPDFADFFPMDSKTHRRSFRRLQRAYVDARYSEHYEITREELNYLQGQVEALKVLVERVCQQRIG